MLALEDPRKAQVVRTSLLRRSLDRGDRGGARDIGPHGPHGLGLRAGVAVPKADGRPCPLTAGVVSNSSSWRPWSSPRARVRISSPARAARMTACGTRFSRLLTAAEQSGEFLSAPALDVFARQIAREGWSHSAGRSNRLLHGRATAGSGRDGRGLAGARRAPGRDVAIKLLLPHPSTAERVRAFEHEARAAGTPESPQRADRHTTSGARRRAVPGDGVPGG